MRIYVYIFSLLSLSLVSFYCVEESLCDRPSHFPKPVYDFEANPLSKDKIALGKALFYDPVLSRDSTISCSSCHSQFSAFTHVDHALSHGIDDKVGLRNSPTLINLAWQKSFMADGAVNHIDMQALAPISNPDEMDESIAGVVVKLQNSNFYPALFYNAFGDSIITGQHTLKAISQFMLTLVSSDSKYDSVIQEKASFNSQELNGHVLFKKNCASCHAEPLFAINEFKNNGLPVDTSLNDFGRYRVTNNPLDSLKFKVPTLRNIEFSYPYMHDGRFKNLHQVLDHYTDGVQNHVTLSPELATPIHLSANEKVDLIAFLLTLSDKSFLFNSNFFYPKDTYMSKPKN